jgi:hypothetical protein
MKRIRAVGKPLPIGGEEGLLVTLFGRYEIAFGGR